MFVELYLYYKQSVVFTIEDGGFKGVVYIQDRTEI